MSRAVKTAANGVLSLLAAVADPAADPLALQRTEANCLRAAGAVRVGLLSCLSWSHCELVQDTLTDPLPLLAAAALQRDGLSLFTAQVVCCSVHMPSTREGCREGRAHRRVPPAMLHAAGHVSLSACERSRSSSLHLAETVSGMYNALQRKVFLKGAQKPHLCAGHHGQRTGHLHSVATVESARQQKDDRGWREGT